MALFSRSARVMRKAAQTQIRRFSKDLDAPPLPNMLPAETWPLVVCIAGGVGLCVYIQARFTFSSPDIRWNKGMRMNPEPSSHVESYGSKWGTHQKGIAAKTGSNVFFSGAKIPTRDQLVDTSSQARLFQGEPDLE